jgi:hypothetical protein
MVEEERTNLLEVIDSLIEHVNSQRVWFMALLVSALIVAPIAILFTLLLILHPGIMVRLFRLVPVAASLIMAYLVLTLGMSTLWLIIGLKEYGFLSKWNARFKKYFSLKEQLDRELHKESQTET